MSLKKKLTQKTKNRINTKFINLNESLPECEALTKNEVNKHNLVIAKHNCALSVLVENVREKAKCVNEENDIEGLETVNAIKTKSIAKYLLLMTLSTHLHTSDQLFKRNKKIGISLTQ